MNADFAKNVAIACGVMLVQLLAALPWLSAVDSQQFSARIRNGKSWLSALGLVLLAGVGLAAIMQFRADPGKLKFDGQLFASILHLQLAMDLILGILALMLFVWPKGGTVALAAFREGYRQPMFWLIVALVSMLLVLSLVIPYYTFGEDFRMMKQISFDMIKLAAVLFGILAAGHSVSEEIEGRTAVTLMSKPVTRRQFLLGKYFGILLAALAMTLLLNWLQNWALYVKPRFERLEDSFDILAVDVQGKVEPWFTGWGVTAESTAFFNGIGLWVGESLANFACLALGFGQVMVMLAIAASLATRMSMIVAVVVSLIFYLLGNLAPILAQVSQRLSEKAGGAFNSLNLVSFLAQLMDKLLPSLSFFGTNQVFLREMPLEPRDFAIYSASVVGYAILYAAMALLVGLFLIEDRDLA